MGIKILNLGAGLRGREQMRHDIGSKLSPKVIKGQRGPQRTSSELEAGCGVLHALRMLGVT